MERQSGLEQEGNNEQQVSNHLQPSKRKPLANKEQQISTQRRESLNNQGVGKRINSERIRKSAQYHKSIGKQKRQQKISIARETTHISYIHSQMNSFQQQLNTKYKRQKFPKTMMQKLQGDPNDGWRQAMNQLLWGIKCFYMNKQLRRLVTNGVINKLCLSFQGRFREQGLWGKAGYLLQKMVFLQDRVSEYILGLRFQENGEYLLVRLYECTLQGEGSLSQMLNCICLITTMMSTNCKGVTSKIGLDRALMYAIKWLQRVIHQRRQIGKWLSSVYRYLVYLSKQISQSWTLLHRQFRFLIKDLIETLNETVHFHQPHPNHQLLLIIISTLTQYTISTKTQKYQPSSLNLPVCIYLASMPNLLNKIVNFTPNQLKPTATLVIKMLQLSADCQYEDKQLGKILQRHIKGQRRKRQNYKQNETYDNNRTTTCTIPIINNFISYLLVIYQHNHNAKNIIIKIKQSFNTITQKILHSQYQKLQENHHLDDTQSNLQNQSSNNRDVQI